jgi:hypothetical protein
MKKNVLNYAIVIISSLALFYLTTLTYKAALMQDITTLVRGQEKTKSKPLNMEVTKLLETIKNKNLVTENPKKLAQAIEELGQRQISEAVPELIEYLNFRRIHDWEGSGLVLHPLPEEGDYPAVGALFSIGKPAMPALIKAIEEKDTNSIESKNALKTIQLIFRDDLSEAVKHLEKAMKDSTTQEGQRRLLKVIEKTKKENLRIQNLNPQ